MFMCQTHVQFSPERFWKFDIPSFSTFFFPYIPTLFVLLIHRQPQIHAILYSMSKNGPICLAANSLSTTDDRYILSLFLPRKKQLMRCRRGFLPRLLNFHFKHCLEALLQCVVPKTQQVQDPMIIVK